MDGTQHPIAEEKQFDYSELNEEKKFLEGLLQQRFNFFIVAFALILAAGTEAGSKGELNLVLLVGFVLCALLGLCVYRAFAKVDAALFLLHQFDDKCMHKVAEFAAGKWPMTYGANGLMGYVVPIFSLVVIVLWAVLANCGFIDVK